MEFPFKFDLSEYVSWIDERIGRIIPDFPISKEWKATCLYTPYGPYYSWAHFLQLRRESTGEDVFISGNFQLFRGDECLFQRNFAQLLDVGCQTAVIQLDYNTAAHSLPISDYTLTISGTLRIDSAQCQRDNESLFLLSSDCQRFWTDEGCKFSDVSLKCGGKSFSAHKAILSARSPVFKAMFSSKMTESKSNEVEIEDISPKVFKILLSYIYTGKTGDLSFDTAEGLLFAADKYELLDLKSKTCDYLKSHASVDDALNLLVLGHLHEEGLKTFALMLIYQNFAALDKEEDFNKFRHCYPSLYMDILAFVGRSRRLERWET